MVAFLPTHFSSFLSSARAATNIVSCSQVCKGPNHHLARHKKAPSSLGTLACWHFWACAPARGHDGGPFQKPIFLSPVMGITQNPGPQLAPSVSACF